MSIEDKIVGYKKKFIEAISQENLPKVQVLFQELQAEKEQNIFYYDYETSKNPPVGKRARTLMHDICEACSDKHAHFILFFLEKRADSLFFNDGIHTLQPWMLFIDKLGDEEATAFFKKLLSSSNGEEEFKKGKDYFYKIAINAHNINLVKKFIHLGIECSFTDVHFIIKKIAKEKDEAVKACFFEIFITFLSANKFHLAERVDLLSKAVENGIFKGHDKEFLEFFNKSFSQDDAREILLKNTKTCLCENFIALTPLTNEILPGVSFEEYFAFLDQKKNTLIQKYGSPLKKEELLFAERIYYARFINIPPSHEKKFAKSLDQEKINLIENYFEEMALQDIKESFLSDENRTFEILNKDSLALIMAAKKKFSKRENSPDDVYAIFSDQMEDFFLKARKTLEATTEKNSIFFCFFDGVHWCSGELFFDREKNKFSLILMDSLGYDHKKNTLNLTCNLKSVFSHKLEAIYINKQKLQNSTSGCSIFSLENVFHLMSYSNKNNGQKIIDYLKKSDSRKIDPYNGYSVYAASYPLDLIKTMQSSKILEEQRCNPDSDYNKIAAKLICNFFPDKNGKPINNRIPYKFRRYTNYAQSFLALGFKAVADAIDNHQYREEKASKAPSFCSSSFNKPSL